MHRNRPQPAIAAVIPLSFVMAALAFAWVQNVELGGADGAGRDGIARMGIEGEGDLPLPVTEQG